MGERPPAFFLDANILFSAAHDPESRSAALVALSKPSRARLLTSSYAREEARRNIHLKRPQALRQLEQILRHLEIVPEAPLDKVRQVFRENLIPEADAPILATALHAGAKYLVTGDRRGFGHLMDRHPSNLPIKVLSLSRALELLLQ